MHKARRERFSSVAYGIDDATDIVRRRCEQQAAGSSKRSVRGHTRSRHAHTAAVAPHSATHQRRADCGRRSAGFLLRMRSLRLKRIFVPWWLMSPFLRRPLSVNSKVRPFATVV